MCFTFSQVCSVRDRFEHMVYAARCTAIFYHSPGQLLDLNETVSSWQRKDILYCTLTL